MHTEEKLMIPDSLTCVTTSEIFFDPIITSDGHTYEREAIEHWFEAGKSTSPQTNKEIINELKTNWAIKSVAKAPSTYMDPPCL